MSERSAGKKTVLVLAHSSENGGAELALTSLIDSTEADFDWHIVFSTKQPASPSASRNAAKVSYLELPWWCYEAHDIPQAVNKAQLLHQLQALQTMAEKADLLVTNTITIPWLGFIAQQLGKPHIWYIHEFGDLDHNLKFIAGYDRSLQMIAECSSQVLTISESVRDHLARVIPKDHITIIHQSINLHHLTGIPLPVSPQRLNRLLCIGAIKPSKGQLIAAEAVEKVNAAHDETYHLDIIGPVANRGYYETVRQHHDPPHITVAEGFVDAVQAFRDHDVVLMCSENEALGRVTLEALATGRIVVGFDAPATRQLLKDSRGIIYSPNTAEALAGTLGNLEQLARQVNSQAARQFVTTHYSNAQQRSDFIGCAARSLKSPPSSLHPSYALEVYIAVLERSGLFISRQKTYRHKVRRAITKAVPGRLKRAIKRTVLKRPA